MARNIIEERILEEKRKMGLKSEPVNNDQVKASLVNPYLEKFKDTPYYNDTDFQNVITNYQDLAGQHGVDNSGATYQQVSGYADTFKNQFKNKVGRDPNASEYNQFFKFLGQEGPWAQNSGIVAGKIGQQTSGLISDNFSRTAQEEAEKKLDQQSKEAVAPNSAFDVWQNSYRDSVNGVEKSLMDYQTKLFEKIRPNLITSLQAQGLLNTGALNEAFSGAAKDLTDTNTNYLASARGAVEQDIANQKYQLASAPSTYKVSNTVGNPMQLVTQGQNALQNVWQSTMANIEANNARNMFDYQNSNTQKPNPLAQYGGMILGGVAGGIPGAVAGGVSNYYANKNRGQ